MIERSARDAGKASVLAKLSTECSRLYGSVYAAISPHKKELDKLGMRTYAVQLCAPSALSLSLCVVCVCVCVCVCVRASAPGAAMHG